MKRKLTIISIFIGIALLLQLLFWIGNWVFEYQHRFVECDATSLLSLLEDKLNIMFPEEFINIQAAKSPEIEYTTNFIAKFKLNEETANKFINENFAKEVFQCEQDYVTFKDEDNRKTAGYWFPPRWFIQKVFKGKKFFASSASGSAQIIVDTSDANYLTIYIHGYY